MESMIRFGQFRELGLTPNSSSCPNLYRVAAVVLQQFTELGQGALCPRTFIFSRLMDEHKANF